MRDPLNQELDDLRAENKRLRAKIDAALQRLNESGTGEIGLLNTIHATHTILKD